MLHNLADSSELTLQHAPLVLLHGVTSVTEGTRKSLFIVDSTNGLGEEEGVVGLTKDDVISVFAEHWEDPRAHHPASINSA